MRTPVQTTTTPDPDITRLITAEFDEMPGMRLTAAQVRRLWNLSEQDCEGALTRLCRSGSLERDLAGRYHRRGDDY